MVRRSIATVLAAWMATAASARAQPPPPPPADGPESAPPPPSAPEAPSEPAEPEPAEEPEPSPEPEKEETLELLKEQLVKLTQEQAKMRSELEALKRKQAEPPIPPPPAPEPTDLPLSPFASIGFRYDNIFPPDPTEQFQGEPYEGGFRMRVRAGIHSSERDAMVIGGVRLALGRPLNPAQGYVPVGDAFAVAPVGLDQFWIAFRPADDRAFFQLKVGKMQAQYANPSLIVSHRNMWARNYLTGSGMFS